MGTRSKKNPLRPELVALRDEMLSRTLPEPTFIQPSHGRKIQPVAEKDVSDRLQKVLTYLAENQFVTDALASRYNTPLKLPDLQKEPFDPGNLRGLDVPTKFSLVPLYSGVSEQPYDASKMTSTICVGMRPFDEYVSGLQIHRFWRQADMPERMRPRKQLLVDTDDVSCWAKFHVIGNERVIINPIQYARPIDFEPDDRLREQVGDEPGNRELRWRIKAGESHVRSTFKYSERGLLLGLIGLRVADLMGIEKVGLIYGDVDITPQDLKLRRDEDPKHPGIYAKTTYLLKKGNHRFSITGM